MKAYHKTCGSTALGKHPITLHRGRYTIETEIDVCRHCNKEIESYEVVRIDRRLLPFKLRKVKI